MESNDSHQDQSTSSIHLRVTGQSVDSIVSPVHQEAESTPGLWKRIYRHRGVLLVILASLCSALQSVLVRFVKEDLHPTEVSFVRFIHQFILPVPVLIFNGISPKPDSLKVFLFLALRGVIGMVGLITLLYAFYYIPIGDATAIVYANPVLVGILARIILKEAFGVLDAVLVVVAIGGVFLISQPPFLFGTDGGDKLSSQFIGAMFAFCTCLCLTFVVILVRNMRQLGVDAFKIVLYYSVIASTGSALITTAFGGWSIPACGSVRFALVGIGTLNCIAQCLITYSLSLEKSVFVSILRTNEVVFAYLLDFLLFNISPNLWAFLGSCLIIAASIAASFKKMWISKQKGIAKKQRMSEYSAHATDTGKSSL